MASELTEKKCRPCEGIGKALDVSQAKEYLLKVSGWQMDNSGKWISKKLVAKNFSAAVDFINKIKDVAESENHHPDIYLESYRNVTVKLSTHALQGLSENDFIMAAKIDELPVALKK